MVHSAVGVYLFTANIKLRVSYSTTTHHPGDLSYLLGTDAIMLLYHYIGKSFVLR